MWAVLRLGQGELKVDPGPCKSWASGALKNNHSLSLGPWGVKNTSNQTWWAGTSFGHCPLKSAELSTWV